MLWSWLRRKRVLDAGERARRLHSAWLTAALASSRHYPQIPRRPVATGGFDALRARPHGPTRSERWWTLALERVDADADE